MPKKKNKKLQMNVDFTNFPELYDDLMKMIDTDGDTDRSKFIRRLIREERSRRQQLPLPFPTSTPQPKPKKSAAAESLAA